MVTVETKPAGKSHVKIKPPMVLLMVLVVAFLGYALPPYLGLDPAQSRTLPPDGVPYYYAALVTHIFLGSVALLAGCLQLWPWLRQRYPQVHRWSGRAYVFSTIFGGLAILTVSACTYWGPNQQAANTTLGVLWVLTTAAGYVKAKKRRYAEHREWMVRSFALCFSIILNRAWTIACTVFLVSDQNDYAEMAQAIGVGSWLSWIVNLLVAEWWLQHTRVTKRAR